MEAGPARQRRRYEQTPSKISVHWVMNREQFSLFESWHKYYAKEDAEWFVIILLGGLGLLKQEARFTQQFEAKRALAYAQNATLTPLGTKLSIPASSRVPDGYEPVWYKNTITRVRYPDFFAQLVDTDSLVLVTEEIYDTQVATYGMCASYVKVDNDTVILSLLVNFARSGTLDKLGNVELDQFQGHWHEMIYRQDTTSLGYRSDIFGNDGYTSGGYSNTGGTDEWM